eukprot:scaffold70166_cov59-Attheya_sp.AAC.2
MPPLVSYLCSVGAKTNVSIHGDAQPTTEHDGIKTGYEAVNGSADSEGNVGVRSGPGRRSVCHKEWP